jgi:phosphatidylinositol dimannoside acyltransferase
MRYMGSATAVALLKLTNALLLLTIFYPLRWCTRCLSWRQAHWIASGLGALHACVIRDQLYRHIHKGIQAVWGDELSEAARKRLVRRNLVTRYGHLVDSFFYQRLDAERIERLVPVVDGKAYLDEALSGGRGAILLVSHFGSFGLLIGRLALRGYRLHQIFTLTPQPLFRSWPWVERAVMRAKLCCWDHREAHFTIWRPGMYLRPLYRQLLSGAVVVLYGDGIRGQRFAPSVFMGNPLSFSVGPFRIAARAQVPLIPAFIIREGHQSHRLTLEPPISVKSDDPVTIQQAVNRYTTVLEHYVRAYPDHWFTWARLRQTAEDGKRGLEFSANDNASYDPRERG